VLLAHVTSGGSIPFLSNQTSSSSALGDREIGRRLLVVWGGDEPAKIIFARPDLQAHLYNIALKRNLDDAAPKTDRYGR
jgi:hypothetical protein